MVTPDVTITMTKQFMVTPEPIAYNDETMLGDPRCYTCIDKVIHATTTDEIANGAIIHSVTINYWYHNKFHGAKLNYQWQENAWLNKPMLSSEIIYPNDNTARCAKVEISIPRESIVSPKAERLMTR